jgi:3-oxoacyl-[acyl-carrier protein] reductase
MKYALVTGGSRGIGKAISIKLASDGYFVLVNYKSNTDEAENTLNTIKSIGGEGELMQFDVSNPIEIENVLGKWMENNNDKLIEVLVNNAGIAKDNLMVFMTDDEWKSVMSTNLDSFFYVTRLLSQNILNLNRIRNIELH